MNIKVQLFRNFELFTVKQRKSWDTVNNCRACLTYILTLQTLHSIFEFKIKLKYIQILLLPVVTYCLTFPECFVFCCTFFFSYTLLFPLFLWLNLCLCPPKLLSTSYTCPLLLTQTLPTTHHGSCTPWTEKKKELQVQLP